MLPLLLLALGVAALVGGGLVIGTLGARGRVGRILAATRIVSVAEARQAALTGRSRYVGVRGRIDAEQEFSDAADRPLVLRRTRFEVRGPSGWRTFDDQRELVPFEVREGLDSIAVDGDRLDQGLVVVPRESLGVASDLGDRRPADLAPAAPVRVIIEQVSSVDHALVLGMPLADGTGGAMLTAGLGRPLVLTTLERQEALRLLGGGRRGLAVVAGVLFLIGAVLITSGLGLAVLEALT